MEMVALIWLGVGIVLILLELVVPGAVFGFIGAAAVLTGVLIQLGHLSGVLNITLTFFISSIFFIMTLRTALLKVFPSYSTVENTDETLDAIGQVVDVIEPITPYRAGRVRYLDTSWDAEAEMDIDKGEQAIIINRAGNRLIVKSLN